MSEETTPARIQVTLADLGVLAATAERNGTVHAFPAVALQWAEAAQAEIERLRAYAAQERAAEREQCAKALAMRRSDAQLMAGELTAQEWRTLSAVLVAMQARIRAIK
jgi:hypothetical protein